MIEYEPVIGLEVHAELSTDTKIFCSCSTRFGSQINSNCCPVCLGMPGTLPVLNKKAVEYAVMAGLAMNCTVSEASRFDRKNYFYPDLPKSYQITQYDFPVCTGGHIEISQGDEKKVIRIARVQIEEDAAKLLHDKTGSDTIIDYNRAGVPLIEIVSDPDMASAAEAKSFLESVRAILRYIGVSDCKMENGSLRADVNISVRRKGDKAGTRTEMKNLNSFRAVTRAIRSEFERQVGLIDSGQAVLKETRRWDDTKGISIPMRSKEGANDYRYFPDPDLPEVLVSREWAEEIRRNIPELPNQKMARYMENYKLSEYCANLLTSSVEISEFFEVAAEKSGDPKSACNLITGEMARIMKERKLPEGDIPFGGEKLARLIDLVNLNIISTTAAKKVLEIMFETQSEPEEIVREMWLEIIADTEELSEIISETIKENLQTVDDYRKGKKKALGHLIGKAMARSGGRADPQILGKLLKVEMDKC